MNVFNVADLQQLYIPASNSHKGQNGKVMVIGGSHLFHAASLWALTMTSKLVDMVFYVSVPENNQIVQSAKAEFRNGIVVERKDIEDYIAEADAILIGPGMNRSDAHFKNQSRNDLTLAEIALLPDEGEQTYFLTKYVLQKYPHKKWVIDAGALQMLDPEWLLATEGNAIVTPHAREFEMAFGIPGTEENAQVVSTRYQTTVLLKGERDIICSNGSCVLNTGGNAGMTKGGTGDVLAGLTAGLFAKNPPYLAAAAASFFNKKAGESLSKKVGFFFNSSDLIAEIPHVMKYYLIPAATS